MTAQIVGLEDFLADVIQGTLLDVRDECNIHGVAARQQDSQGIQGGLLEVRFAALGLEHAADLHMHAARDLGVKQVHAVDSECQQVATKIAAGKVSPS